MKLFIISSITSGAQLIVMPMGYPLDIIYLLSTIYYLLFPCLAVYSVTLTTVSRAGRGNCLTTGISTNQSSVFTVSTNHSSVLCWWVCGEPQASIPCLLCPDDWDESDKFHGQGSFLIDGVRGSTRKHLNIYPGDQVALNSTDLTHHISLANEDQINCIILMILSSQATWYTLSKSSGSYYLITRFSPPKLFL